MNNKFRVLVSAFLVSAICCVIEVDISAQELNTDVGEEEQISLKYYDSSLPTEFSRDITINEIQEDIIEYIDFNSLEIQYGSEEYAEFMTDLATTNIYKNTLNPTAFRFYKAYASVYLSNNFVPVSLMSLEQNMTINDIRNKNSELNDRIQEAFENPPQVSEQRAGYNVSAAQEYAHTHAIVPNLSYPLYPSDCTNFASQILVAGGYSPNSSWHYNEDKYGTAAFVAWVNAGGFVDYWGVGRGHVGKVFTNATDVNNWARPGDFIVWFNPDTVTFYHTQFVQSKDKYGYIHCSQHTSNYYNVKFMDRVEEDLGGDHIYWLSF